MIRGYEGVPSKPSQNASSYTFSRSGPTRLACVSICMSALMRVTACAAHLWVIQMTSVRERGTTTEHEQTKSV